MATFLAARLYESRRSMRRGTGGESSNGQPAAYQACCLHHFFVGMCILTAVMSLCPTSASGAGTKSFSGVKEQVSRLEADGQQSHHGAPRPWQEQKSDPPADKEESSEFPGQDENCSSHRHTRSGTPLTPREEEMVIAQKVRSLLRWLPAPEGSNSREKYRSRRSIDLQHSQSHSSTRAVPIHMEYQCTSTFGPPLQQQDSPDTFSLHQPMLVRHPISIREHPATLSYDALVLFGVRRHLSVTRLSVHVFEVEQNNGQTWRLHDQINVTFLPPQCRDPHQLLLMVAPSMNREKVFIYGFGVTQPCSKLPVVVYDPSKRSHLLVRISDHNFHIPTTFSAMTAIDTGAKINESLVVFGGTHCQSDEVTEMSCRTFSDDIFVLEFDAEDYESGRWDVIRSDNTTVDAYVATPTARISSAVFTDNYSALLVYGGVSLSEGSNGAISLTSECDVWSFDFRNRNWKKMNDLKQDCIARSSESCFAANQIPMRPFASFSTERRQLEVLTINFASGVTHLCMGQISASRTKLDDGSNEWHTLNQTETSLFSSSNVGDVHQRTLSTSLVLHGYTLYMVETASATTQNISVTFDYDRNDVSLSWRPLPRTDRIFRFPGNLGCIAPSPLIVNPRRFEENSAWLSSPYALMIGGFCPVPQGITRDASSFLETSWKVMPIWTYSLEPGPYALRLIHPGPPFSHRILHTTVLLEHSGVSKAVLYGGVSIIGAKVEPDVWCYDVSDHYWLKANLTSRQVIPQWGDGNAIAGHVAFAVTNTSFVIYGGAAFIYDQSPLPKILNTTFMFTFSNLSACRGSWMDLSSTVVGKPLPHRLLHTLTLWNNRVYIAGGFSDFFVEPTFNMFIFTATVVFPTTVQVQWTKLQGATAVPGRLAFSLTGYTSDMLLLLGGITFKCTQSAKRSECIPQASYLIRLGYPGTNSIEAIPFFTNYPIIFHHLVGDTLYGGFHVPTPVFYNVIEEIPSYGVPNCLLRIPREQCPLGFGLVNETCRKCEMGFYSNSLSGVCEQCANFTVTKSTGSTSCFAPNPCYENFCHGNGKCLSDSSYIARCDCKWGYVSYDRCQVPLAVLLMSVSVIISTLVIIFVVYRVRSSRKISKQREKDLMVSRWQLRQLANGVIIKWDELQQSIIRQIGAGSGGNVYLAELSDMSVAVKVLRRCRMNDIIFLEQFSKEIELMRTVRHPNIVMFLGAGTQPTQHYEIPFIVMEYMTRESLSKVLQINRADITYGRRVSFALDIAKGMEFLHSSTTPRIHRDLKSSNMLVTSKWNVKIADFGMLRLQSKIRDFDTNNPEDNLMANCTVYRRCQSIADEESSPLSTSGEEETAPLLPLCGTSSTETNLTQMMGSFRWCAPETLTAGVFNKYTDVYSYGVVLWEILTHGQPYNDTADDDEVIEEIARGERLPFPPSQDAYHFKKLIEACWCDDAEERPLFPEIVQRLTSPDIAV